MDLQKIKALINLAATSSLSELELEEDECHLRIVRDDVPLARKAAAPVASSAQTVVLPAPVSAAITDASPSKAAAVMVEGYTVNAPMFGVFCLKPAPTEAPFVQVGDIVQKGQKICMLEAMKLFHSLEAERTGRVVAILVAHGQEVDAGQPLLRIE